MHYFTVLIVSVALAATSQRPQAPASPHAGDAPASSAALLRQALAAQGGEKKLRALKSVQWEALGYRNMVEQSERPEGPYLTEFDTLSEIHDFAGSRYLSITTASVAPFGEFSSAVVVDSAVAMRMSGKSKFAGSPQLVQIVREREALSPERLLLTALDASDSHREADTTLQSMPQNVVAFSLDGAPVRIYLNTYTHLPTAVDYSGPMARSGFWSYLGDVMQRTYYSFWWLAEGGIHYPTQWNVESNGLPDRMLHIHKIQIDANISNPDLIIPNEVRAKYAPAAKPTNTDSIPLGIASDPAKELASGIVFIPGAWNATIVRQDDGIVILEAPISSGYSAKVVAEARRRFPRQRIKAVISTSDAWPHIAGIRHYVAEQVPIYALDVDRAILARVIAQPYTSRPDSLQRVKRDPTFHLVTGKTVVGSGPNRMEIYPIRGETTERQLMVYFPEHHLLYGSDAFQRDDKGVYFYPQTITELMDAVSREKLDVNTFFMMHVDPTPWSDLARVVSAAEAPDSSQRR